MRVIAIDGPAGSGKSTVAKAPGRPARPRVPRHRRDVPVGHLRRPAAGRSTRPTPSVVAAHGRRRRARCAPDGGVTVDGVDATIEIRGPEVSRAVSIVAANPAVRAEMVRRQREWVAGTGGGVLEGRDIGTVVFPDADLKVYLDRRSRGAGRSVAPRRSPTSTTRRWPPTSPGATPSTRAGRSSPLAEADDAFVLDTTGLTVEEIVDVIAAQVGPAVADARPGDDVEIWTGEPTRGTRVSYALRARACSWCCPRCSAGCGSSAPRTCPPRAPSSSRRCTGPTSTSPSPRSSPRRPMRYMGKDIDLEVEARSAGSCRCSAASRCTAAAPTARR